MKHPPASWKDLWNVADFPGRRSLRNHPFGTTEIALMADGVPTADFYPCDMDCAFSSLYRIGPKVNIWWSQGAQSTQLIQSGEVAMIAIRNCAAQRVIDAGEPRASEWDQKIANVQGWIVLGGTAKA